MLFNIFYFILSLLITSIFSYLTFPLYEDDFNFTSSDTPKEIIEKMLNSKLYIYINIGSEKTKVKSYLVLDREEFMIAGNEIAGHKYNESNSKTYNCSYCKDKDFDYGYYSKGIFSTEDFNIESNKNEIKIIHNMKFILGTETNYKNPPEGFVGLHLPFYDSDIEYNLIRSLKNANATKSYYWFLNFGNESNLVVDGFPHEFNNKKYNSKIKNVESLNGGYYTIWGLDFSNIYYNNKSINISIESQKTSKIQLDYKLIIAPDKTGIILEKLFFEEYFKNNICFKENLGNYKEYFIYCKNIKGFKIDKFKSIYFKSVELNSIFELNYKDLFYYKDNYVYFLMLFKGSSWIFGELFLRKYFLVFNQDAKTIGYYEGTGIKNEEIKKEKFELKDNLTNILLILILISIIVVGIILYFKKGKRKNRANELNDDDYEYNSSVNNVDNNTNKILED